jgi:hypothetical protein
LYEKIVFLDRIRRDAKVSDPAVQFVLRRGKKKSYLFLLNYHNEKKTCTVNAKRLTLQPLSCRVLSIRG